MVGPGKDGLQRDTRKLLGVMEMFCILTSVAVSLAYGKLKMHRSAHFN